MVAVRIKTWLCSLVISVRAASSGRDDVLRSVHEVTVDQHISELMPLYLSDHMNTEWNTRLSSQRMLSTDIGVLVHQLYELPWPLSPRDMLMRCNREIHHRDQRLTSVCVSVDHPDVPRTSDVVRLSLKRTFWEITALPGDRTRLHLELEVPRSEAHGVPKFVVNYMQRASLRDAITSLVAAARRLKMPPHPTFIGWRRSNAAATAASRAIEAPRGLAWGKIGALFATLSACAMALLEATTLGLLSALGLVFGICRASGGRRKVWSIVRSSIALLL